MEGSSYYTPTMTLLILSSILYVFHANFLVNAEKSNFKRGAVIGNADVAQLHNVVISIQQNNLDKLKAILKDISDYDSPNYGKHLTREKIAEYTKDQARIDRVIAYFTSRGAKLVAQSKHGEHLTMSGPVSLWNAELNTTLLHKRLDTGDVITCAHSMDIPHAVKDDVFSFFNVLQIPRPRRPKSASQMTIPKIATTIPAAQSSDLWMAGKEKGLEALCSACTGSHPSCCSSPALHFISVFRLVIDAASVSFSVMLVRQGLNVLRVTATLGPLKY